MRLFVAARPSPAATEHLAAALVAVHGSPGDPGRLRWTDPATWHVTLAFLGEVDPDRLPGVTAAVEAVARERAPIPGLALAGAGAFGTALWIGLAPAERCSPIDRLARAVQRGIRATGVPLERRPWRGHLTIARGRTPEEQAALAEAMRALRDYAGPPWELAHVEVVHSLLGPPLEHRVVARAPLHGGASATPRPPRSPTT